VSSAIVAETNIEESDFPMLAGKTQKWQFWEISYFTFIGLPSPLPSDLRLLAQSDVDQALRAGRTVASRLGGVATLRLRNAQGVLQEIGSRFTMPANAVVSGDIVLRVALSGSYRVESFRILPEIQESMLF